MERLNGLV